MSDSQRSPRRGQQTKYDYRRRNTFIAIVAVSVLVIAAALFAFFNSQRQDAESLRRNVDVRPRNTDLWFVYPDNTVRFAALFYAEGEQELYSAAGPLIREEEDILAQEPINAEFSRVDVQDSPAEDQELIFSLYELRYTGNGDEPYGVNVLTQNSAYVSPSTGGNLLLLGSNAQPPFLQVIVAVGFPAGTDVVIQDLSIEPYRTRTQGGWDIYYFDTGAEESLTAAIRLEYNIEPDAAPREPDLIRIDSQR